jgi:hypothetical protein
MPWFKTDVVRLEAFTVYVEAPDPETAQAGKARLAAFSPPASQKGALYNVAPDALESPPPGAMVVAERDHCLDCGGSGMCGYIDLDATGKLVTRDVCCGDCGSQRIHLAGDPLWPEARNPLDAGDG